MKKTGLLLVFTLFCMSVFGGIIPVSAGKSITLKVGGKSVSVSEKIYKVSGGYSAYSKDLAKVLKAKHSYRKKKKEVVIKKGKKKITFKLNSKKIKVNKKAKKTKVKAALKSQKPYVDILFTAKLFGYPYSEYNKKNKTLNILKKETDNNRPSPVISEVPVITETPAATPESTSDTTSDRTALETDALPETPGIFESATPVIETEEPVDTGPTIPVELRVYSMDISQTDVNQPIVKDPLGPPCAMTIGILDGKETVLPRITGTIEGRGNSTWRGALAEEDGDEKSPIYKAPFKLEFSSKVNMLGMGAAKKWVLLANRYDKSLMRNAIAFGIGQQLFTEFCPRFRFVELTLNGDYKGLYMLTDQIEEDDIRVDIKNENPADPEPAFMLEWDQKATYDNWMYEEIGKEDEAITEGRDYFTMSNPGNTYPLVYKYPKPKDLDLSGSSDTARKYIKDFMASAAASIKAAPTNNNYESYIDVQSFYDYFIVNQYMLNFDCNTHSSIYMYKRKDGKLRMGPIWDFDLSAGATRNSYHIAWGMLEGNPWYSQLLRNATFKKGLKDRWNEVKDSVLMYGKDAVDVYYGIIGEAAVRNHDRWGELDKIIYDVAAETSDRVVPLYTTYKPEVIRLKNWLSSRYTWMDNFIKGL